MDLKTKSDVLGEHPVFSEFRVVMPVHDSPDAFRKNGKSCCKSQENEEEVRDCRRQSVGLFGDEHLENDSPISGNDLGERFDDEERDYR